MARTQESSLATTEVPFVGRDDELRRLRRAADRVSEGDFSVAIVSGESGIGKSRLLAEVRRLAVLDGIRCLTAQPVELEKRISLNPILDALSALDLEPHLTRIGEPWRTVVGAMLPSSSPSATREPPPPIDETALSRRLMDAFSLLLHSLAEEEPTILFIDDLQWVDATTIAVLEFYGRRYPNARFGVFATVRPELVFDEDPVEGFITNRASLTPTIVRLGDLPTTEAERLIHLAIDVTLPSELVSRLFHLGGRHPLFLIELAREAVRDKEIVWEAPQDDVVLPTSIREMVSGRTRRLSKHALHVARLLAVRGKPMAVGSIAEPLTLAIPQALEAADELRLFGLARVSGQAVGLSHEVFSKAIYHDIPQPDRAVIHGWVADALGSASEASGAGEVAVHLDKAGKRSEAAVSGRVAADELLSRGALSEAAHFYGLVARNETDPAAAARASERRATALYLAGPLPAAQLAMTEAAAALREVGLSASALRCEVAELACAALARSAADPTLLPQVDDLRRRAEQAEDLETAALALDIGLQVAYRREDRPAFLGVVEHLQRISQLGATAARTISNLGMAMGVVYGDPEQALAAARTAVTLSEDALEYRPKALLRLMVVLQLRGQLLTSEGRTISSMARAAAEEAGDVRLCHLVRSNLATGMLDAGEIDAAHELFRESSHLPKYELNGLDAFNWANNRAELALVEHSFAEAAHWFETAASRLEPKSPAFAWSVVHSGRGLSALESGDLTEARRCEAMVGELPKHIHFDPSTILAFRVRLLENRGRTKEGADLLELAHDALAGRLEMAWLKVGILRVRKLAKWRIDPPSGLAPRLMAFAQKHGLDRRAQEIDALARRDHGQ